MILQIIVILAVYLVLRKIKTKYLNYYKNVFAVLTDNKIITEKHSIILFLSIDSDHFEVISNFLCKETFEQMIVILDAPDWHVNIKKKKWTSNIVISKNYFGDQNLFVYPSFLITRNKNRYFEVTNVIEYLQNK